MTTGPHPDADKIREALIRAKTERQHGETMEDALLRELAARGLVIVDAGVTELNSSSAGRGI